jgi:hypothetical protein
MGPYNDWPTANPARNVTMVICTAAAEVWKTFSITGMAGRYMSIDSGAKACSIPSRTSNSKWRKREIGGAGCAVTVELTSLAGTRRLAL